MCHLRGDGNCLGCRPQAVSSAASSNFGRQQIGVFKFRSPNKAQTATPAKRRKRRKKLERSNSSPHKPLADTATTTRRQSIKFLNSFTRSKQTQLPSYLLLLIVMPSLFMLSLDILNQLFSVEAKVTAAISAVDGQLVLNYPSTRAASVAASQWYQGPPLRSKFSKSPKAAAVANRTRTINDHFKPILSPPYYLRGDQRDESDQPPPSKTRRRILSQQDSPVVDPNSNNSSPDGPWPSGVTPTKSQPPDKKRGKFELSTTRAKNDFQDDGELGKVDSFDLSASEAKQNELLRKLSSTMLLETLLRQPFPINKSPFPALPSPMTLLPSLNRQPQSNNSNADDSSVSPSGLTSANRVVHRLGFGGVGGHGSRGEHKRGNYSPMLDVSTSNQSISTRDNESGPMRVAVNDQPSSSFNASSLNYLVEKLLSVKPLQSVDVGAPIISNEHQQYHHRRPLPRKKSPAHGDEMTSRTPPPPSPLQPANTNGSSAAAAAAATSTAADSAGFTTLDKLIRDEYDSRVKPMIKLLDEKQKLSTTAQSMLILRDANNSILFDMSTTKARPLNHRIEDDDDDAADNEGYLIEATSRSSDSTTTLNPPDEQQLTTTTTTTSTGAPPSVSSDSSDGNGGGDSGVILPEPKDGNSWVSFEDLDDLDSFDETLEEDGDDETSPTKETATTSTARPSRNRTTLTTRKSLRNVPPYQFQLNDQNNLNNLNSSSIMVRKAIIYNRGPEMFGLATTENPHQTSTTAATGTTATTSGTINVPTLESPNGGSGSGRISTASRDGSKVKLASNRTTKIGDKAADASTPRGSLVFSDGANEAERAAAAAAASGGKRSNHNKAGHNLSAGQRSNQTATTNFNRRRPSRPTEESPPPPTTGAKQPKNQQQQQTVQKSDRRESSFLLDQLFSTIDPLTDLDLRLKGQRANGTTALRGPSFSGEPQNPLIYKGYVGKDDYLFSSTARDWSRPINTVRQQDLQQPSTRPSSYYPSSSYYPPGNSGDNRRLHQQPMYSAAPPPTSTSTTPAPPTEPPSVPYNYFLHQPATNAQSVPTMVIPTSGRPEMTTTPPPPPTTEMPRWGNSNQLATAPKRYSYQLANNSGSGNSGFASSHSSRKKPAAEFGPDGRGESPRPTPPPLPPSVTSDQNWSPSKVNSGGESFVAQRKPATALNSAAKEKAVAASGQLDLDQHQLAVKTNGSSSSSAAAHDLRVVLSPKLSLAEDPVSNLFNVGDTSDSSGQDEVGGGNGDTAPWQRSPQRNKSNVSPRGKIASVNLDSSMGDTDSDMDRDRPRKAPGARRPPLATDDHQRDSPANSTAVATKDRTSTMRGDDSDNDSSNSTADEQAESDANGGQSSSSDDEPARIRSSSPSSGKRQRVSNKRRPSGGGGDDDDDRLAASNHNGGHEQQQVARGNSSAAGGANSAKRANSQAEGGILRLAGSEIQITEFDKSHTGAGQSRGSTFNGKRRAGATSGFRLQDINSNNNNNNNRPIRANSSGESLSNEQQQQPPVQQQRPGLFLYPPASTINPQVPANDHQYFGDQSSGSEIPSLHSHQFPGLSNDFVPTGGGGQSMLAKQPTSTTGNVIKRKPSFVTEDPYQLISSDNVAATIQQQPSSSSSTTAATIVVSGKSNFADPSGPSIPSSVPSVPVNQVTTSSSTTAATKPGGAADDSPPANGIQQTNNNFNSKTTSGQRTGSDRLAFILIGGSCALSVVCLVLAAMSMRCQDMCDDYRSLRNAERAALKLQKHRLKYTKNHQQISRRHHNHQNHNQQQQQSTQAAVFNLQQQQQQLDEQNFANQHNGSGQQQHLAAIGLAPAKCRSKCLNDTAQFADSNNAVIWNSQQQQQLCKCSDCWQPSSDSHLDGAVANKDTFGAWLQQPYFQQQQHRHLSASRLRPLFGAASSVGTFFPRRRDEQHRFAGGSSDAQILIDSQPSCAAATFNQSMRNNRNSSGGCQLVTRSKSILAKGKSPAHLNHFCEHHHSASDGCNNLPRDHHSHQHHNQQQQQLQRASSTSHCNHNHSHHHHHLSAGTNQLEPSEPTSDDSVDELLAECDEHHLHQCASKSHQHHHHHHHQPPCNHHHQPNNNQLKPSQVKSQAKLFAGQQQQQQHHHHHRAAHQATTSSGDSVNSALGLQCTCSHSATTADHQPLLLKKHQRSSQKMLAISKAANERQAAKREKQLIWSANGDRLI